MKRYVLDSYAVLAYCDNEEGAVDVAELLAKAVEGNAELFFCVVNWGEMYYISVRKSGEEKAELFRSMLAKYPVAIIPADMDLTLQAARLKAHHKISFADAFAAALAKVREAELVTGAPEFKPLEREIKIRWI